MKAMIISCLSAGLALAATVPAAAVPRVPSLGDTAYINPVADSEFAAKKDEYMQSVKREMQEWGDKLHHVGSHAEGDLDRAWIKTKNAAHQLQAASADDWGRARQGFENSMRALKDRWHKIHPENE
jgi:hypothetical protein